MLSTTVKIVFIATTAPVAGALLPSPLPASEEDHQFPAVFIPPPHQFADETESHWSAWSPKTDHNVAVTAERSSLDFNRGNCTKHRYRAVYVVGLVGIIQMSLPQFGKMLCKSGSSCCKF